jgi:hypothetical protein
VQYPMLQREVCGCPCGRPGTSCEWVHERSFVTILFAFPTAVQSCVSREVSSRTPSGSPGAVDPGVTQANLAQTICRSGFSSLVRAPASETDKAKKLSLQQYGETTSSTTEYDHLISLEVGGTNATSNLWPEPNATNATGVNNPKDPVENQLHTAICSGRISLVDAQKAIATNWTTALNAIH